MDALGRLSPEAARQTEKLPVWLVLDNVRSMQNVGSIFRTADAFGIAGIWLCGFTPQPPHRDIHKTALGATETVAWRYTPHIMQALDQLQAEQFTLAGVEQAANSTLLHQYQFKPGQKLALILGNEVEGVQQQVLHRCSVCLEIPQFGAKHSLNIAVSAGVVLWQLVQGHLAASNT